jgi:hypothetical protein
MEITKCVPDKQADKKLLVALETLHNQHYQENSWNKILECLQAGANVDTALHFMLEKLDSDSLNIEICQRLLEYKANPNIKLETAAPYGQTALFFAAQRQRKNSNNLIDLLLKHGARSTDQEKISTSWSQFYACTPLGAAIIHNQTPTIQALCQYKAPLTNIDQYENNAFHVIADSKKHRNPNDAEKNIKTIMSHSYFDLSKSDQKTTQHQRAEKELLKEKFILILYSFNKARLHKDTQLHIFANLPEYYIFHDNLRNTLIKSNYKNVHLLTQVHYHVKSLKNILQVKNKNMQTALDIYRARSGGIESSDIFKLFSGEKLKKDYAIFTKKSPAILNNNIVLDIYNNYAKLCNHD